MGVFAVVGASFSGSLGRSSSSAAWAAPSGTRKLSFRLISRVALTCMIRSRISSQQHRHQGEEDIQHLQDLFQQQRLRREGVKQQLEKGRQLPVLVLGQHQHGQQGRQHHCDH